MKYSLQESKISKIGKTLKRINSPFKKIKQYIHHKLHPDHEIQYNNTHPQYTQITPSQKQNLIPYQIQNKLNIEFIGTTTYRVMLQNLTYQLSQKIKQQTNLIMQLKEMQKCPSSKLSDLEQHVVKIQNFVKYNARIIQRLQKSDSKLINNDIIYLFFGDLMPANIQWQIWKHQSQIMKFIKAIQPDIKQMGSYDKYKQTTGDQIIQQYEYVKKIYQITPQNLPRLLNFFKLLSMNRYLRKSQIILTFISHCLPINLWHIKVYKQVPIYSTPNILQKCSSDIKLKVIKYLTVTSDGIMINDKNPLQSKIDQIIPFTNQFLFICQIQENGQFHYHISSCSRENIQINFEEDYIAGINFHIGLVRAYIQSGNVDINRFSSYSHPRQNCWTRLYNDGVGYFQDLCVELLKARKQVCITDWWMTPYFLLKRNQEVGVNIRDNTYRLDGILKQVAQRGVTVFIILFRQPLSLVCNDSYDCQIYLQSLSRNIRIRRHPITPQLWSHHQKCVIIDQRIGFMGGFDLCYGRWDTPEHYITNVDNYWDGGDYTNQRLRQYTPGTTKYFTNSPIDRVKQARMPWHDIGLQLRGDAVIDLTRHFIQYWYFVNAEKVKDPCYYVRNLQKRWDRATSYHFPDRMNEELQTCGEKIQLFQKRVQLLVTGTQRRVIELSIQSNSRKIRGDQQLQMCRSTSPWSIGARDYEQSIHNAYQALIRQAQHFIYIENQFFMGNQNKIVECLADRVRKAHLNGQNFKVIVVMPLLPGFEGDISVKTNVPLRIQVHNQYQSINRGQKSLFKLLSDLKDFNINDYIFFFGLRNHGTLNDHPITQIVYVHSKMMIVDDKRAIIGSANINDRSLCGNRDSELAIVIQEDNGDIRDGLLRRKQIYEFRARLFNEHFSLSRQQTANFNTQKIWAKIINNAKNNTLIYRQLFGCYPDDTITVGDEVQERCYQSQPWLYETFRHQIIGHAVEFPLHFMEDELLQINFGDKEQLIGIDAFL